RCFRKSDARPAANGPGVFCLRHRSQPSFYPHAAKRKSGSRFSPFSDGRFPHSFRQLSGQPCGRWRYGIYELINNAKATLTSPSAVNVHENFAVAESAMVTKVLDALRDIDAAHTTHDRFCQTERLTAMAAVDLHGTIESINKLAPTAAAWSHDFSHRLIPCHGLSRSVVAGAPIGVCLTSALRDKINAADLHSGCTPTVASCRCRPGNHRCLPLPQ